ncbi:hypothetical protein [Ensifer sp.]|jgi:hypothetical protein|uniref:hypothetical protein n=1 Tax=Ensifer sp. TaxID=1872086 RepID=UPI002E113460|nr:hypothetical protein [Ensifer sp.]
MQAFRKNSASAGVYGDFLPPEPAGRSGKAQPRRNDFVDADFEVISATSRRTPYPVFNDNGSTRRQTRPTLTVVAKDTSPAARLMRMAETRLRDMPARRFAGLVAGFALASFLAIVGFAGSGQADVQPLAISGVTSALNYSGGLRVLSVYGSIDNRSDVEQRSPVVVVEIAANGRKVTTTRVMPEGAVIAAGESRHFMTKLPYAGGKMPDVTVSFAENGVSPR